MVNASDKCILIISVESPLSNCPGTIRLLAFIKGLKQSGWRPLLLTSCQSYEKERLDELGLRESIEIFHFEKWDASKIFSIKNIYPNFLMFPDRYWLCTFSAIKLVKSLMHSIKPKMIYTSFPHMTNHLISLYISKKYNIPLITEFRDPLQCYYNPGYRHYNYFMKKIELLIINNSKLVIHVTKEASNFYKKIYHNVVNKFHVIENGHSNTQGSSSSAIDKEIKIFQHSGSLYSDYRKVDQLFMALKRLKYNNIISSENFRLVFRGEPPGTKTLELITKNEILDIIDFKPKVSHLESFHEMQSSFVNVVIQPEIFYLQIPSKIYQCIHANRPLLVITPKSGATYNLAKNDNYCHLAWSQDEICASITALIEDPNGFDPDKVDHFDYSLDTRATDFIKLIESIV